MNGQISGANFPPLSNTQPTFDMSKVPISVQSGFVPQQSMIAAPPQPKKTSKNPSAAEKRCDLVQSVMLNQDPFGLKKCECLINMSKSDIQAHRDYVLYWIQRGYNFSLKARKAAAAK